jgi:Transposase zinc-binding domain
VAYVLERRTLRNNDLGHEMVVFNSCRNRHCPKCQSSAREKWLASQSRDLLPVPYCHLVFTLPHELAMVALQNPKMIYGILFRAVPETQLTIAADPRRPAISPGGSTLLQ